MTRLVLQTDDEDIYCSIDGSSPGPVTVYMLIRYPQDVGKVRFRVVPSPGLHMEYLSEVINALTWTGNTQDGIEVDFEACLGGERLVATIMYNFVGTSEPCSYLEFAPHPSATSGSAEVWDCRASYWKIPGRIRRLYVKNECDMSAYWCILGTPTEETTWGAIKALYE